MKPRRDRNRVHFEILEDRKLLAAVTGRHVFYEDSAFDGGPGIDPSDSAAIATDKQGYFTIEQLSDDATFDGDPQVHGSNVVWQKGSGSGGEVFWYDGTTVTQLTTNAVLDEFPQVSALGIAWERFIPGGPPFNREIIFHDTVTSEESLTTTAVGNSTDPVLTLSDNRLAWEDQGDGDFDIHTWNDTGSPTDLSLNTVTDIEPDADGNNVAWVESGSSPRLMRYFNGTSTSTIGTSTFAMHDPEVSGQNVVWEGFLTGGTNNREIFFYNGTTVQALTTDSKNDFDPKIDGNKIVWWSLVAGVSHIQYFDGSTVTQLSTLTRNQFPQIDGDNVVWQGFDGNDHEIFHFDGTKVTQLTDNDIDDTNPQISGNHVVWQGAEPFAGGTSEIYHAFFNDTALPANMTSYSKGLNGLMIDVANPAGALTLADFTFRMSGQDTAANNSPSTWVAAPAPTGFTVLSDTPVAGTDRVEFIWANNAIENRYLEVTVEGDDPRGGSNTNTGLSASDVSYFGNIIGDSFVTTPPTVFLTTAADETAIQTQIISAATITSIHDMDRNGVHLASDRIVTRGNTITAVNRLVLGTVPLPPPPPPAAAGDDDAEIAFALTAATPSTAAAANEPAGAVDVRAMPAESQSRRVARYFEHLDGARGASGETDSAAIDEAQLPDDVLDGLLQDLLGG